MNETKEAAHKQDAQSVAMPEESAVKDVAMPEESAVKDVAMPKESAVKDVAMPEESAVKDVAMPKESAVKDVAMPKESAVKDVAMPEESAVKEDAPDVKLKFREDHNENVADPLQIYSAQNFSYQTSSHSPPFLPYSGNYQESPSFKNPSQQNQTYFSKFNNPYPVGEPDCHFNNKSSYPQYYPQYQQLGSSSQKSKHHQRKPLKKTNAHHECACHRLAIWPCQPLIITPCMVPCQQLLAHCTFLCQPLIFSPCTVTCQQLLAHPVSCHCHRNECLDRPSPSENQCEEPKSSSNSQRILMSQNSSRGHHESYGKKPQINLKYSEEQLLVGPNLCHQQKKVPSSSK